MLPVEHSPDFTLVLLKNTHWPFSKHWQIWPAWAACSSGCWLQVVRFRLQRMLVGCL